MNDRTDRKEKRIELVAHGDGLERDLVTAQEQTEIRQ